MRLGPQTHRGSVPAPGVSAARVVAHAPPEDIPAADKLIGERLRIFEDLSLQSRVERLGERVEIKAQA